MLLIRWASRLLYARRFFCPLLQRIHVVFLFSPGTAPLAQSVCGVEHQYLALQFSVLREYRLYHAETWLKTQHTQVTFGPSFDLGSAMRNRLFVPLSLFLLLLCFLIVFFCDTFLFLVFCVLPSIARIASPQEQDWVVHALLLVRWMREPSNSKLRRSPILAAPLYRRKSRLSVGFFFVTKSTVLRRRHKLTSSWRLPPTASILLHVRKVTKRAVMHNRPFLVCWRML